MGPTKPSVSKATGEEAGRPGRGDQAWGPGHGTVSALPWLTTQAQGLEGGDPSLGSPAPFISERGLRVVVPAPALTGRQVSPSPAREAGSCPGPLLAPAL